MAEKRRGTRKINMKYESYYDRERRTKGHMRVFCCGPRLLGGSSDPRISDDPDGESSSETRKTDSKTGAEMQET